MRAGLVLAAGLLLAACRTPTPFVALPRDDLRGRMVLEHWTQATSGRRGLHARARLSVDATRGDGIRIRSRQMLWLERPGRMRVAIQSPVRTTVAILVTDGTEYALRGADGSRESGPVHRALLWEVARLDLTPEQAVDVILGVPGLAAALSPGRCYAGPGGELRLELVDEAGRVARVADFDAEGRLSRLEVRDPAQQPSLVVRLSDYAVVAGTPLAHELSIEAGGVLATLNLSDAELNPALPADIFRVELPSLEGEGG